MDRRARVATVAVAALVVLAGCNALAPSGSDGTDTPTVTPVPIASPTETGTGTPTPRSFAGVTEANTLDVPAIVGSHERHLENRSFTFVWVRRTTGGAGPIATSFDRRALVENGSTYLVRANGTTFNGTLSLYADPDGGYRHVDPPNGSAVTARTQPEDDPRSEYATVTSSVASVFFVPAATEISVIERDGRHYARLFSRTVPEYVAAVYGDYQVENYTMTAWIAPEGYVRTIHYEFTLVSATERIHREVRYLYEDVGETTVSEPAWVRAFERNRTGTPARPGPGQSPATRTSVTSPTGTPTPTDALDGTPTPSDIPDRTPTPRDVNGSAATPERPSRTPAE